MLRIAALLVLFTSAARADGFYYTEGFGGADVHNELAAYMDSAFKVRVGLGVRMGEWAVEGFFSGAINVDDSYGEASTRPYPYTSGPTNLTTYGLDLKKIQTVSPHLSVYVRGSMSAAIADGELDGYRGRGLGVGAGAQLKGKVSMLGLLFWPLFFVPAGPKMTGALWLDTGYDFYRLHGPRQSVDGSVSSITFGFALGSDF